MLDGRTLSPAQIDADVTRLMHAGNVPGLAVALIRNGRVVYAHAYGVREVATNLPLQTDTVMYGASLTKATFAYFVMQLVDEGRLDLDRPIADYLPKPLPEYPHYADLASDPRWRMITPRMLLDHTTGFANFPFLEPDQKLHIHWQPGSRYSYSGEGINTLQFVLEEGLHIDVGAEMQRRIFDRFGMTRTSLHWRDDFADNVAQTYGLDGALVEHDHRSRVRAAGSMDTTLDDWSTFLAAVARGEGLSAHAKAEMTRLQIAIDAPVQFPTLSTAHTDANAAIRLGYGLGWGVFETPYGHAYFKEGHDDGTANYGLCVAPHGDCILLLSNSVRAEGLFKYLVDDLMGDTHLPWAWQSYTPYDQQQGSAQ
ncbi:MAG: serine hydrolase domain-containing protein [Pseudomonadota bacterium]